MTQTLRKLDNRNDYAEVDIYYHPNNPHAKISDKKSCYRYTVFCEKFTFADFQDLIDNFEGLELEGYVYDTLNDILDCFKNSKTRHIWKVRSRNGHDDYEGFFATKEEAIADMMSQDC